LINKSPTFKAFRAATFLSRSSFESLLNPQKIIQYAAAISYEEKEWIRRLAHQNIGVLETAEQKLP